MSVFLLINGPNLNPLGSREPEVCGATRRAAFETRCVPLAGELGQELSCFQSNAEHELIERVQTAAADGVDVIILNPGGVTHSERRATRCHARGSDSIYRNSPEQHVCAGGLQAKQLLQ